MEPLDALGRAQDHFASLLALVDDNQLANPTPCGDWDVTALVRHVGAGNALASAALAGASRAEVMARYAEVDAMTDPRAAFRVGSSGLVDAFAQTGALERTCQHPAMEMTGETLLNFRIGDLVLHGWDLARGAGLNDTIDPELVEVVYLALEPMADVLPGTGMFGNGRSGALDPSASRQTQLLDIAGRRP